MNQEISDIKDKILQAVAEAQNRGYTICSRSFGIFNNDKYCCPIGAVILSLQGWPESKLIPSDFLKSSSTHLGVDNWWSYCFTLGFDGFNIDEITIKQQHYDLEACKLGAELRQELNPVKIT